MNNYIPYQIRSKLMQIDPNLDQNWHFRLKQIFADLNPNLKKIVQEKFLAPKNIFWNSENNHFKFTGQLDLNDLSMRLHHAKMQSLAKKILGTLDFLKKYQQAIQVADYLESILNQIDNIDVEDNLNYKRDKQLLRKTFLYDAAKIIKALDLTAPDNCRNLTIDEIRSFILEVYIKHEILGYWFKTLLPRQIKTFEQPIFKNFIVHEQKTRDFEMIESSQYFYIIATIQDYQQNPYSIRRFLMEEKLGLEQHIYLNGIVLDLEKINQPDYLKNFQWQISRIITVQRHITPPVIELMDHFHSINFEKILPILQQPLDASGYSVEEVVNNRLIDLEKLLTLEILQPFQEALLNALQHPDEFEFCFLSLHRLFTDLLSFYKDFSSEPAITFSNQAKIFEYRIISYLKLLEKRKDAIFSAMDAASFQQANAESQAAIQEVKKVIATALDSYKSNQMAFKRKQRELEELNNANFFKKMFKKPEKIEYEMTELKAAAQEIRRLAYLDLVKIPKKHQSTTVYLEFESFISINDTERHYGFCNGENGVSLLPILVQLPEDKITFNLQTTSATLNFDLTQARQKWLSSAR